MNRQQRANGQGTVAGGLRGVSGPRAVAEWGARTRGPILAAAPRGRAADALSPCAVVIEDDRIDDVLKGMGEKPPSGV